MFESLSQKEIQVLRLLRNAIVHRGISPSIRYLMQELGYKSPRSISLILEKLMNLEYVSKDQTGKIKLLKVDYDSADHASTIDIPLVGSAACGSPILAEENIEAYFKISTELAKPPHKYFLLRAQGDSMNQARIHDGDLVLVRQTNFAESGDKVVALIDDEATIKEFKKSDNSIILNPKSTNKQHQPIILQENFQIQGVVVSTI